MSETLPEFTNLERFRDWFLAHPEAMGVEVLTKVDESHCVVKLNGRVFRALLVYDAAKVTPQELLDADLLVAYRSDIEEVDGRRILSIRVLEKKQGRSSVVRIVDERKVARFQSGGKFYQHVYTLLPPTNFTEVTDSNNFSLFLKPEQAKDYAKESYMVLPWKGNSRLLIVNSFWPLQAGWLYRQNAAFKAFIVSPYVDWIYPLPKEVKDALGFSPKPKLSILGETLQTGKENQEWAFKRYIDFVSEKVGEDALRIKRGKKFHLTAELIRDGILPFTPQPVSQDDLRDLRVNFELRDYQLTAWKDFLEWGAAGIYWPPGAGKTLFCVYASAKLKGRKVIVTRTRTILEQFDEYFSKFAPQIPRDELDLITYNSAHKVLDEEYVLAFFDEAQYLPAPTFSVLAGIRAKYRLGASATPMREDGAEHLIFALTGKPLGVDWSMFREMGFIKSPEVLAIVVDSLAAKLRELDYLVRSRPKAGKTIIFSDSLDLGKQVADTYSIPFIHGETRNRLESIKQNDLFVISRVGDLGVSIKDLRCVIEIDFLLGSRQQEAQRMGRLLHSEYVGDHYVLFTAVEFERYKKRLYGLIERGFEVKVERR